MVCAGLHRAVGSRCRSGAVQQGTAPLGHSADRSGYAGLRDIHCGVLALHAASAAAHHGRDPAVVLLLHERIRTADLPAVALPVDPQLLDGGGDGLRPHQHPEARDPRPDADARPAEPVVHPACYGLHVLLLGAGVCLYPRLHGVHQASGRLPRGDRQAGLHRTGLSDRRHAHRLDLGQGGLGPLLELGPEGDLGRGDVGRLSALCPPAPVPQKRLAAALLDSDRLVSGAADVLVRGQLPPGGPAECSHVFTFLVI